MKNKLFALLALIFCACEEPYTPIYLPEDSAPILIIDGFIDMSGDSRFQLSYTMPLGAEESTQPAVGARLSIESENNENYNRVTAGNSGHYTVSHPALNMGNRYRVRIHLNGKEYLSDWITPYATSEISEIEYKRTDSGLEIYVSSENTDENSRYYRWQCEETWKFSARYRSSLIFDRGQVRFRDLPKENISVCFQQESSTDILINSTENLSDNTVSRQQVRFIPKFSDKLMIRYSILVKQFNISREAYQFWSILKKNSESVGDIFGAMPSELKGNVHNVANPSEPVIAMIEASRPTEKRIYFDAFDFTAPPWQVVIPFYAGCEAMEVPVGEAAQVFSAGSLYIPVYEVFKNEASPYPTHFAYTTRRCTDCSLIGSLNQPDFWTDID